MATADARAGPTRTARRQLGFPSSRQRERFPTHFRAQDEPMLLHATTHHIQDTSPPWIPCRSTRSACPRRSSDSRTHASASTLVDRLLHWQALRLPLTDNLALPSGRQTSELAVGQTLACLRRCHARRSGTRQMLSVCAPGSTRACSRPYRFRRTPSHTPHHLYSTNHTLLPRVTRFISHFPTQRTVGVRKTDT